MSDRTHSLVVEAEGYAAAAAQLSTVHPRAVRPVAQAMLNVSYDPNNPWEIGFRLALRDGAREGSAAW